MRSLFAAIDFDDTLFSINHGEYIPNYTVINFVKALKSNNWKIILWTCRSSEHLGKAIELSESVGITFDYINENPEVIDWYKSELEYEVVKVSNKVFADFYLDDRNITIESISDCHNNDNYSTFLPADCYVNYIQRLTKTFEAKVKHEIKERKIKVLSRSV